MGSQLKVSSDRLVKPGIKPATPGLKGKRFIHYTTSAPSTLVNLTSNFFVLCTNVKDNVYNYS